MRTFIVEVAPIMHAIRYFLATLIWLLDLLLKQALGVAIVFGIWFVYSRFAETEFNVVWTLAGLVLGSCIAGFFEGCDLFLLGWAKRLTEDR